MPTSRVRLCLLANLWSAMSAALTAQVQWQPAIAAPQPHALGSPGLCWDGGTQAVLLFGGDSSSIGVETGMWSWNGSRWTELQPAIRPAARTMCGMVWDSGRQRVVLFGGYGAGNLDDTWEWDGTAWQQRFPNHAPSPRGGMYMAYDSVRARTVLFGGGLGGVMMPTFDDTWEWDGVDWTRRFPAHAPLAARSGNLVFDSQRNRCVLFGGLSTGYVKQNDTWEWDGVDWTQRFPAHVPIARYAAGMAFDSARARTVLFGGGADVGPLQDTWEFDGQDWSLQSPTCKPSNRDYVSLAFDPLRASVVMRGSRIADTWQYGAGSCTLASYAAFGFGTGCAGSTGMPFLATFYGQRPILGTTFNLSLFNLPPDHSTLMAFGLSNSSWLGTALPLALGSIGAPGCNLLVSLDATYPLFNWAGQTIWSLPIPNQPALAGMAFYNQAAVIDHSNALGLVFTNGGGGVVGNY
ncbi:MAG: hypothetical protein MUC36_27625 [Planctomycetes bacterium]|nr:hypothetical protein [Planctomycetota bacterium]